MSESSRLEEAPESVSSKGPRRNGRRVAVEGGVRRATRPRPVPAGAPLTDATLYFNRELSWLDFNWRVLMQAEDDRIPLLERVRFLCITSTNLDEFFRKRVGGLKRQAAANVMERSPDGRSPQEQLLLIQQAAQQMHHDMTLTWDQVLKPELAKQCGIHVLNYADLDEEEKLRLTAHFRSHIFPILTPLAVDPGHPFPFLSNLSLSLAVMLRNPKRDVEYFARLKVPTSRGRWVPLLAPNSYVPLEQVIAHNIHELFRGMEVLGVFPFRVTRNADLRRNEEEADDLISMISEELRERRFAPIVRLEIERSTPRPVRDLLLRELALSGDDIFEDEGLIDHSHCMFFADLPLSEHRYDHWEPIVPVQLLSEGEKGESTDIFRILRDHDLLVHHPYESFRASVQRFVEEAATDPKVLAIKQTLYRTSDESPIVAALVRAAENGKQVAVLVEVKARFDEESNIEWGQQLEKSGVHVTYGVVGLKTHCKVTLVVREEREGMKTYCHIGTGNYNPATARFYTDFGLFTADPDIGADAINLFHYLTGYAPQQHYHRLIVAPRDLRPAMLELIRREIAHAEEGRGGHVMAKMNALDDTEIIRELYRASQAGVRVDLLVRGHCRLRPQVVGYSENIRVVSIVGRFLEHSRVYYFGNAGSPDLFIGSADWQRRNLEDRVEVLTPVSDLVIKGRLIRTLQFGLQDRTLGWTLNADGRYLRERSAAIEEGSQNILMERARQRRLEAET
jgi:polyphosphate kinase